MIRKIYNVKMEHLMITINYSLYQKTVFFLNYLFTNVFNLSTKKNQNHRKSKYNSAPERSV